MAEEKKDAKPAAPAAPKGVSWEEVILLILGIVALLFVFIPRFLNQDTNQTQGVFNVKDTYNRIFNEQEKKEFDERGRIIGVSKTPSIVEETRSRVVDIFNFVYIVLFSTFIFLILLFSMIIYYNKFRRELIINAYKKRFETEEAIKREELIEDANEKVLEKLEPDTNGIINPKWQIVGRYYNSANQSDWKLAIMEADIMLYEVLDRSGFPGESIGEMLKNTDRSKLNTLDEAWSAHKVRNEIAHSGTDYVLSRTMVEKTIAQYEKVFDELNYI